MTRALRVLVVEDESLVAMLMEDMLRDLGHVPVGPVARLEAGLRLAASEDLDMAVLDVNLGGNKSSPIADMLIARGIAVVFATGYGSNGLEERFKHLPVLAKPFSEATLAKAIGAAVSA